MQEFETANTRDVEMGIQALHTEDSTKRQKVRETLVAAGYRAVPALLETLQDMHGDVRWEAAHALMEIKDPRAAEGLAETLMDERADVRWIAAEGLVKMGKAALVPVFRELIRHSDNVWLKEGAHHVLTELCREQPEIESLVTPTIEAIQGVASDVTIPAAALDALDVMRAYHPSQMAA